jgi:hypothetical protein
MKTKLRLTPLLVAACTLAVLPLSAAPGDVVIRTVTTTVSVDLAPTPAAPASATGSAVIKVREVNAFQNARVILTAHGLAAGHYQIVATLADASVAVIGTFRATAAGIPAEIGKADGTIVRHIPASVDATKIASVAVVDANSVAILEGGTTIDSSAVNFFASVGVTGPGVRGHAVAHSKSMDGVESQRQFFWASFGAPPNTLLTIKVDGTAVGTVLSTSQGSVFFSGLNASVDLASMQLITLTNVANTVIMQAQF